MYACNTIDIVYDNFVAFKIRYVCKSLIIIRALDHCGSRVACHVVHHL